MVGFKIGLPIIGDIAIGVWFGDHKAELDRPAFAYVCHTAFLDVRIDAIPMNDHNLPCMLLALGSMANCVLNDHKCWRLFECEWEGVAVSAQYVLMGSGVVRPQTLHLHQRKVLLFLLLRASFSGHLQVLHKHLRTKFDIAGIVSVCPAL